MFHFSNKQHTLRFYIDLFCIAACYMATAIVVRHQPLVPLRLYDLIFQFTLFICWYYTGKTTNLYTGNMGSITREFLKTFYNIIFQLICIVGVHYIIDQPIYLDAFTYCYLICMVVVMFAQKLFINAVRIKKVTENQKTNVLIIGGGRLGMKFYDYVKTNPASGYNIIGVLDDHEPSSRLHGDYLGKISLLPGIFNNMNINEVVVALPGNEIKSMEKVISIAKNEAVHVKFLPDVTRFTSPGFTVQKFGEMLMVNPRPEPLEALHWRAVKRLFDITFSLLVLTLLCSWLFPIIALIIKLNSKGPVFFKQLRSGKNTVPFYCYKFRSMYLNDDAHLKKATKNDPRITIVGKILRKTNIDELPQFFNVLMGTMAVVGPRPHMVSQNKVYSKIISQYLVRQLIKPGVTGWAQVSGYRGETKTEADMQNRIEHDVWYLEHWSFALDIKIIFLTIWNMIRGEENAY